VSQKDGETGQLTCFNFEETIIEAALEKISSLLAARWPKLIGVECAGPTAIGISSSTATFDDDVCTEALPGKMLRSNEQTAG
jgi:hypothetical protein